MSSESSSQEIRQNKIKEMNSSNNEQKKETTIDTQLINAPAPIEENISSENITLSSYDFSKNTIIIKYRDDFYICNLLNKLTDYKMINKYNFVRVLKNKQITLNNFLAKFTSFLVKIPNDEDKLKICLNYTFMLVSMEITYSECATFELTKMTDQLSIINERLKNFEKMEDEKEKIHKNVSTYFYELFSA